MKGRFSGMAKKIAKTNAARILEKSKLDYTLLQYESDDGLNDGLSVAAKIGYSSKTVHKTLVTAGLSKQPYVFVIPVNAELDLKMAAKAAKEKVVEMIPSKDILALTGYVKGGCSPIGMKKDYPTFISQQSKDLDEIIVSAGKIGTQLKLKPSDLAIITNAQWANIVAL